MLLGGDHTHPYPQGFSKTDVSNKAHGARDLFIDPVTHQVRGRELMLFFREKTGECRSFSYDNTTHVIAALHDGQWVPVGQADDEGNIQGRNLDVH